MNDETDEAESGSAGSPSASGQHPEPDRVEGHRASAAPGKPELVFGLVGPVGTDLHGLAVTLEEKLGAFGYKCIPIRVSALIRNMCEEDLSTAIDEATGSARTRLLMNAGDELRKSKVKGDALIPLIVAAIRAERAAWNGQRGISDGEQHAEDLCYIVDSLKHPDEITTLRKLYGDGLVLISAFESRDARIEKLQRDIAKSNTSTEVERFRDDAELLVEIDSKRPGRGIGQNVRDSFPMGDFFLRVSGDYDRALGRFLDLLFGSPYLTPHRSEQFMSEASMAALRSADLSRQIGAVIVGPHGHILAAGCNDVPMAGGGTYWPDEPHTLDNRDFTTGQDFNAVKKFDIISEMLRFLEAEGLYARTVAGDAGEVTKALITGKHRQAFKELRISNLIEFGRVVHAEMAALMLAAQRGLAVDGSTLYSTTFPCHMCARHIIASGILHVVYIEPYPKSMTAELFPESVSIDERRTAMSAHAVGDAPIVRFTPYEGIAPRLYGPLFRAVSDRKDQEGYIVDWHRGSARPKTLDVPTSNLLLERQLATELETMRKAGLGSCRPTQGE